MTLPWGLFVVGSYKDLEIELLRKNAWMLSLSHGGVVRLGRVWVQSVRDVPGA